jgi:hypothetical protein
MAVARGAVDDVTGVHQRLTGRVDIIDAIGQMAEIAASGIDLGFALFRWPVIGQLDLGQPFLSGSREEDQREAPRLAVETPNLFKPDQFEKGDRRLRVGHADHAVEIFNSHHSTHRC